MGTTSTNRFVIQDTVPLTTQTDVTGLTLSNTQIIKITGQGGGASPAVNDVVCKLGRIRFEPAY